MDVVHHGHVRLAQPQRREEGDAVDHLEHHVGVAADPAHDRQKARGNTVTRPPIR